MWTGARLDDPAVTDLREDRSRVRAFGACLEMLDHWRGETDFEFITNSGAYRIILNPARAVPETRARANRRAERNERS